MIPGFRWQVIILFGVTHCYGSVWWNNVMDPTCFFVILVTSCTCPSTALYTTEARKRSKVTLQNWVVDTRQNIIFNFLSAEVKTPQLLICRYPQKPGGGGPWTNTPDLCFFLPWINWGLPRSSARFWSVSIRLNGTALHSTHCDCCGTVRVATRFFKRLLVIIFLAWLVTIFCWLLILCSWKFEAWRWMKLEILLKVVCPVLIFSKQSETFHDTPRSWGSSSEFCIPKIYQNNIKPHYLQQERRIRRRTYVSYKSSTH